MTRQIIKRGLIQSFAPATYTATVLILEATSYVIGNVPVATSLDSTSAITGASCAVLFLDEHNPTDALILAVYGSVASPAAGRVVFVPGFQQLSSTVITSGTTLTLAVAGNGGIPGAALGVVFKAFFTSPSAGSFIHIAPHGASSLSAYATIGNLPGANAFLNGNGVVSLSSGGQLDIQANGGNCTTTLFTYGYLL